MNEGTLARLREIAEQHGESPEQFLVDWADRLARSYPDSAPSGKRVYSALNIIGSLPDIEPIHGGNEEIDRILAEEAMNPHDDEL